MNLIENQSESLFAPSAVDATRRCAIYRSADAYSYSIQVTITWIEYMGSKTHRHRSKRLGTFHLKPAQVYYTCIEMAYEAKTQLKLNLQRSTPAASKRVYFALLPEPNR